MEELIKAWKGWRLEFACTYGSDMDGATEYSSYTTYDWSADLGDIIANSKDGKFAANWITCNGLPRQYSGMAITAITPEKVTFYFYYYDIELTKEKPSYGTKYCYGHGDYHDVIRLLPPGEKEEQIKAAMAKK